MFLRRKQHKKKFDINSDSTRVGFTLIEILVSISIIVILSSVVLWNQSQAAQNVNLANATNELLVRLREAQTYGVSVKVTDTLSGDTFDAGYGLYLAFGTDYIIFFADKDGDNEYDGDATCQTGATYECLDKFILRGNVKIVDMCGFVGNGTGNEKCAVENNAQLDSVSIVYQRPTPATNVQFYRNNGATPSPESFRDGRVVLKLGYDISPTNQPPADLCRKIDVYKTGQITSDTSC